MQLIYVDTLCTQSLKASLNGFAKVRGSCIVGPLVRAGPVPASLGGNYKASRVRKQRFGNQFLAYIWTVGVRGIDEIDIKLDGPAKNRQSCFAIFRGSPYAFAGKAHCPEAETMHGTFPAAFAESSFLFIMTSKIFRLTLPQADCPDLLAYLQIGVFLAKPLGVGVGAVEPVARFIKLELPPFRSLCCFCQKRSNLGRIHRLKTAGRLESLLKNRKRVAPRDNNAGRKVHSIVKALHRGGCFALENNVVTHRLHTEHTDVVLNQDRQHFRFKTIKVRVHYVERHLNGIEREAVL